MSLCATARPPTKEEEECVEYLSQHFPQSVLDPEDADFFNGNTYLRFARARNADTKKASDMLMKCVEWRKNFQPYKLTYDDVKVSMQQLTFTVAGRSREGHPIIILTIGAPNNCETEDRVKQLVYIMEEAHRKKHEELMWIIDFGEMRKHPRDARSTETRKATMKIMQDYYPELMTTMLLCRCPWYIGVIYKMASPFIDANTRKKIFKLKSDEELVQNYVDPDQLPEKFGGTFRFSGDCPLWEIAGCSTG